MGFSLWTDYEERQAKAIAIQRKAAVVAAERARLTAAERVRQQQAIELARRADNLVQGHYYARKPDPEVVTNEFQIRRMMSHMSGDLDIIGWAARRYSDKTYVVSFTYRRGGETFGWPFEVSVDVGVVRSINGDPELELKYANWWGR